MIKKIIFALTICLTSFTLLAAGNISSIQQQLAELEARYHGKIGVAAINTANRSQILYRANERFPFQSTFKVIGVAAVLKSCEKPELLQQKLKFTQRDLVFWSPISKQHLKDGMTIADLCAAVMEYSDNTATNVLLKKIGGPESVNAFAHSIGNNTFQLNGWEPNLNSNSVVTSDTATPVSMAYSLQELLLGNALPVTQREQLISWMKANTTGNARIRAGVPKGWQVADKTGTGSYGIVNDIGLLWPPNHAPIIVAIYFKQPVKNAVPRNEVIATATRLLLQQFAQTDKSL